MTQPAVAVHARGRCEACHRTYRIPNADHAYRCKACGGTVRAVEGEPPPERTPEESARIRHKTQGALKHAYRVIDGVRWLYRLGALAYGVATLFAVVSLARHDVPPTGGVVVVALTTSLSVLMLMGSMHILFKPFVWTVVIASLATAVTLVHAFGPNPYGLAVLGAAAWAVLAWGALMPTLRFRRLIAEHKDLYILQHASVHTRRSLQGHTAPERHERLLAAMRRAARRAWKLSTAVAAAMILASALGTWGVLTSVRTQPFSEARAAFEAAWNGAGLAAIEPLIDPRVREVEALRLAGYTAGHGWGDALPELSEGVEGAEAPTRGGEDGGTRVEYVAAGVPLAVHFVLSERAWTVAKIELPVPPLEPVVERLLEAWSASDLEALVQFFSEENRDAMLASLERSVERRGWTELPAVHETHVGPYDAGDAEVDLALERGKVETRWHLRANGSWGMNYLKLPRR